MVHNFAVFLQEGTYRIHSHLILSDFPLACITVQFKKQIFLPFLAFFNIFFNHQHVYWLTYPSRSWLYLLFVCPSLFFISFFHQHVYWISYTFSVIISICVGYNLLLFLWKGGCTCLSKSVLGKSCLHNFMPLKGEYD